MFSCSVKQDLWDLMGISALESELAKKGPKEMNIISAVLVQIMPSYMGTADFRWHTKVNLASDSSLGQIYDV